MPAVHEAVVGAFDNIPNSLQIYDLTSPCVAVVLLYDLKAIALLELARFSEICLSDSNSIDLPQIFGISDKLGMISGVTVVYCVETKKDETYIGAVFRNAEVYKQGQYYDISMTGYYIKADSDNVFVIPEGKRKFKVLMSKNYLYVSNENISLYINEISKDEFCVKFDDSIVREGMKEAGNDTDKLKELFNTVFFEKYQTRKAEPIVKKLRSLCNDAKTTEYYATFLQYSSKPAEALKLFTSLLNKNPDDYDYLLIRIAVFFNMCYNKTIKATGE